MRVAPGNVGLRRRLVFGFGAQSVTMVVLTGERFLMVPLYLYAWGVTLYEDWLLLSAATGFVRLVDFGLERYFSASLRMSFSAGQREQFQRHISTALGTYLLIVSVAILGVTAFAMLSVRDLLGLTALTHLEASVLFWIMAINRLIMLPISAVRPIYSSHGEFSRGENWFTFVSIAQMTICAALLALKAAPMTVAIVASVCLPFISWMPMMVDQRRRYHDVHYRPALPNRQEFLMMRRKAGLYLVRDWGDILMHQLPVLLIGMLARHPGLILIFNVSRTLTGLARQFAIQFARIGGIEMSRQVAQHDRAGLLKLYISLGRGVGAITGMACAMILVTAEPLIATWTGGHAQYDPLIIYTFIAAVLFSGPAQNTIMLLTMSNIPRPLATAMLLQIGVATALMMALVPIFGPLGAAVAIGFSDCLFAVWSSFAAAAHFQTPEYEYTAVSFGSEISGLAVGLGVGLGLKGFFEFSGAGGLAMFYLMAASLLALPSFFLVLDGAGRRRVLAELHRVLMRLLKRDKGGPADAAFRAVGE